MNERDLFRAIGDIDEDLIAGADKKSTTKRPIRFYLSTAVAACLCVALLFVALRFLPQRSDSDEASNGILNSASENLQENAGVTSPNHQPDSDPSTGNGNEATVYGTIAPTESAHTSVDTHTPGGTLGEAPHDFSFTISWDGKFYDSATGVFTDSDGQSLSLRLTETELAHAWQLVQQLEGSQNSGNADFQITCTTGGNTTEFAVSDTEPGTALTVCKSLTELIDRAMERVR